MAPKVSGGIPLSATRLAPVSDQNVTLNANQVYLFVHIRSRKYPTLWANRKTPNLGQSLYASTQSAMCVTLYPFSTPNSGLAPGYTFLNCILRYLYRSTLPSCLYHQRILLRFSNKKLTPYSSVLYYTCFCPRLPSACISNVLHMLLRRVLHLLGVFLVVTFREPPLGVDHLQSHQLPPLALETRNDFSHEAPLESIRFNGLSLQKKVATVVAVMIKCFYRKSIN